jgi:hypothetical protein
VRRPSTSNCAAPAWQRHIRLGRSARTVVGVAALLVCSAVAVPAWAAFQGDDLDCSDPDAETPVDEYGFAIDPELLVPCDELTAEAPPADPEGPSPALIDPDPDAGRDLSDDQLRDAYGTWRSTTAASLVDEYFQQLLLHAEACDPDWFDRAYEGPLRVADDTTWRAATHTAMASIPDPVARASLYEAQTEFWEAGTDCDQLVDAWLDRTEVGLAALDVGLERLRALA